MISRVRRHNEPECDLQGHADCFVWAAEIAAGIFNRARQEFVDRKIDVFNHVTQTWQSYEVQAVLMTEYRYAAKLLDVEQ